MSDQQHPFFSVSPLPPVLILTPPPPPVRPVSVSWNDYFIVFPIAWKISLMFELSLALVSMNWIPNFFASASPSAFDTCRSDSGRSHLLPTSNLEMPSGWDSMICLSQFSMELNVLRSLMAQTRRTPEAPLQQVSVIVLKRSCPAVSQICIFILTPSIDTVLILKSTPMVVMCAILYSSLTNRNRMLVLPTALSPMITTFTMQSQGSCYFLRDISIIMPYRVQSHILIHIPLLRTRPTIQQNHCCPLSGGTSSDETRIPKYPKACPWCLPRTSAATPAATSSRCSPLPCQTPISPLSHADILFPASICGCLGL